jgi:hypothetical protein
MRSAPHCTALHCPARPQYAFIAGMDGIPAWGPRLAGLQAAYKEALCRHSPEFQVGGWVCWRAGVLAGWMDGWTDDWLDGWMDGWVRAAHNALHGSAGCVWCVDCRAGNFRQLAPAAGCSRPAELPSLHGLC